MEENFPKTYWGKLWNSLIESMYYDEKVVQIDRPKYRDEFIIRIDFTGNKIFALLQADNRSPHEIFFAINRYSEVKHHRKKHQFAHSHENGLDLENLLQHIHLH